MLTSVDRLLFVRRVPIFKELRDDFVVRLASVMMVIPTRSPIISYSRRINSPLALPPL
ncbi:putative Crp/Fnr family transcriptional regulator [Sphaerospermopsis reniformis]|uniref:Putative Crp/Fnr family transcriptional regulator n=1 Tax=Sphaerospermopsis reniformis TaxID=531300 RepID=A0A480A414_9CYAN|nr:putative Crp/Fnr family transcriptional regulator [Sphaerospermopsis reniformis]